MDYKEFQESIVDYLSDNLSEEKKRALEQFLIDNPTHQEEFDEIQLLWNGTSEGIPEPSMTMDQKFYSMLKTASKEEKSISFWTRLNQFFVGNFPKQLAYTFVILAAGFFVGTKINSSDTPSEEIIQSAKAETENVRSQLVLTLLDQPSANKRLQAVNEVSKMNKVTETVIKALFTTLSNDANVNVRLSAVEALSNYTDIPLVRQGLIASIAKQESPLVQIALADLMVAMGEKGAVQPMKKLIEKENVNESAKQKMEQSIEKII